MRTLHVSSFVLAAALALVITAPAVKAQEQGPAVVVNIPFAFQIESSHYPAGRYTVEMLSPAVLTVQSRSGSGMMQVFRDRVNQPSATSKLIFHHYGEHYFLRELRIGGDPDFVTTPISRAERRARMEQEASNRNPRTTKSPDIEVAVLVSPR